MSEDDLLEIVRAQEDRIRSQRFESAYFWDRDGNLLLAKDGEPTTVKFTDEEVTLVKRAVSTHNHPQGWKYVERDPRRAGYSFSENDVQAACQASLFILRIVTPKFRYMIKPPLQGWDDDYWEKVLRPEYQLAYREVMVELKAQVQVRQILQTTAESLFRHLVWSRVTARLGLEYIREEF